MTSINLAKNGIYKIQVNNKGECIEIDIDDIGTPMKCYESLDKIKELEKNVKEQIQEIIDNKSEDADRKITEIENNMFIEMRKLIDNFLGENACQKIFGNRNYYSMFNDLFDELNKKRPELGNKSHFDMMGLEAKTINEKIMKKYQKGKENVI